MSYTYDLEKNGDIKNHFLFINGTQSDKIVDINPPLKNVIGLEVNSALIPRSEYTIEETRNTFEYYIDGDKQEIIIPIGDMTLTDIITNINTISGGAVVLTNDPVTSTVTATATGTSFFIPGSTKLNKMLGFNKDTPGINGSQLSSLASEEISTTTINDFLSTDLIHVINSPYLIVDYKTTYNSIERFKLTREENVFERNPTFIRYFLSKKMTTEGVYNSTSLVYLMGMYYISATNDIPNNLSFLSVNYIFFLPSARYKSYNFREDNSSFIDPIFDSIDLTQTPSPFSSIPVTVGSENIGDILITSTQRVELKLLVSGTFSATGERYNVSGTDVILLKSNIDGFINGGKFNTASAPLAKFYVNHEENSQYIQKINYEQPSRLFFPIFELSKLELQFIAGDTFKNYQFHGLDWYLHIVVKTIDYKIPNPVEEKLPPRAEVRNIIEESKEQIEIHRNEEELKKMYRRVVYAIVTSIVGVVIYRRYANRKN